MNITDAFIEQIQRFIDREYAETGGIVECLKDYTVVLLAGAATLRQRHADYLDQMRAGGGMAAVVGSGRRADPLTAALLNGMSAHVLELDDGHRFGMLHPSVPVFSALLSAAYTEDIDAAAFLRGAAAGYDAMIRLACMVQPAHKKRGFHASATCGTVGAAVALATARNCDGQTLRNAIAAAATSASGLLEMIDDDSELKPFNCAQSAVSGIVAANVGRCGYRGPMDPIGGKRGFIRALSGEIDEDRVRSALDMRDLIGSTYKKPYASCRHTHSAVEAALALRRAYPEAVEKLRRVRIDTYDLAVFGHDSADVRSVGAAKMSTPYSVAVALVYGRSSLDAFTPELVADERLRDVERRVEVRADDALSKLTPGVRAAIVDLETEDGRHYTHRVDYPKGEPENPLTEAEAREKRETLLRYAGKSTDFADALNGMFGDIGGRWNDYLALLAQ